MPTPACGYADAVCGEADQASEAALSLPLERFGSVDEAAGATSFRAASWASSFLAGKGWRGQVTSPRAQLFAVACPFVVAFTD